MSPRSKLLCFVYEYERVMTCSGIYVLAVKNVAFGVFLCDVNSISRAFVYVPVN